MAEPETRTEPEAEATNESKSIKSKVKSFLKISFKRGKEELEKGTDELVHKGKQMAGLGPKPNVIPAGDPNIHCDYRKVEVGWHPVAGFAGKWFAEQTGLGKMITEKINEFPDPTQHWAVLVDDYSHELWMDENLDVIYINGKVNREEWHTFEVGRTRFNDEALRQAGEMVIFNMRQTRAAYNLISNNCQTFAVALLDAIQIGAYHKFATSYSVYQAATGEGSIEALFDDQPEDEAEADKVEAEADKVDVSAPEEEGKTKLTVVQQAQGLMNKYTTQLDTHSFWKRGK